MSSMKPTMVLGSLLIMSLIGLGPVSAAADAPAPPDGDAAQSPEERALAFRQTFGLDASTATIEIANSSPNYSSDPYGVPLSLEERLELARRAQVERASEPAADFGSNQATWGGYYIDQLAGGAPVFLFTADTDKMYEEIARILPAGIGFRVEVVDRTLASLEKTKQAIVDAYPRLRESGIAITGAGLNIASNRVVVDIDGRTAEATNAITAEFGDEIEFHDSPAADADACPWSSCRPMKGGIRIVGPAGSSKACTSGFIVRRTANDALAVLTAGHCLWAQTTTPYGDAWYHLAGSTADTFGYARYHGFHDMSYGDVGLIEIQSSESVNTNAKNKIWTDRNGGAVMTVTGYVYDSYQTQGSQACAYGAFSDAYYCTIVNDPSETKVSTATPAWGSRVDWDIQNTKVYGYDLIGGDSGGPIFRIDDPIALTVLMLGTHVHSNPNNTHPIVQASSGWYTPWNWGRQSYYQASGYTDDYVVCTTSAC